MKDDIQSQRVVSQGGLNTLSNYLTLSSENPGAAVRLQNFESSLSGGYRRINGFVKFDADFSEVGVGVAEGPVLGVWNFYNHTTSTYQYMAARKTASADNYRFYLYTSGVGWAAIATGITHDMTHATNGNTVGRVRAEIFNHGTGNQIIFVDGVNPAVVFNGTTWYSLTSAGAGGAGSPGGDQLIDAPSVVTSFKGHILVSGDVDFPAIVAHSAPTDSLTWTAAAGGGQVIADIEVVQIKPFRDECYVFGISAIKKLIPDPAAGFIKQDVTTDLGCIAKDSVIEIDGNLLFLSHDGVRPIAGTDKFGDVELGLLSQDIQDRIDALEEANDMSDLVAVVIRDKTQFRYFYSGSAVDVAEATGLIGSARVRPQAGAQSQNRWEFSSLLGIRANCTWSGTIDFQEITIHGDYDGHVYTQEVGGDFNGAIIPAIYTSPYIDMGDTVLRKTMRTLQIFIKPEGDVLLNVGVRYDWGRAEARNPSNYVVTVDTGIVYDDPDVTYDDPEAIYAGVLSSVFKANIQGSCLSVQYIFSTEDISFPYTIHGFVQEFSVKGRQ